MLKILLCHHYDINPSYHPVKPEGDLISFDAALIIGNEALRSYSEPAPYVYDLGDLWYRKTGYPVVFALFAIQRKSLAPYRREINNVISSFEDSITTLNQDREIVVRGARKRYPEIIYDIEAYYNHLEFRFTETLKKALMYFFTAGADLGLLRKIEDLEYYQGL